MTGYCPECGAPGVQRERRPDGNDTCEKGHVYPSACALERPDGFMAFLGSLWWLGIKRKMNRGRPTT